MRRIVVPFFLLSARLWRNLARRGYQNSNDPARPESATQLWVDGRIIHVVSHRRGPVVNLSHLHNRVSTWARVLRWSRPKNTSPRLSAPLRPARMQMRRKLKIPRRRPRSDEAGRANMCVSLRRGSMNLNNSCAPNFFLLTFLPYKGRMSLYKGEMWGEKN